MINSFLNLFKSKTPTVAPLNPLSVSSGQLPEPLSVPSGQLPEPLSVPSGQLPEPLSVPSGQLPEPLSVPSGQVTEPLSVPSSQAPEPLSVPSGQLPEPLNPLSSSSVPQIEPPVPSLESLSNTSSVVNENDIDENDVDENDVHENDAEGSGWGTHVPEPPRSMTYAPSEVPAGTPPTRGPTIYIKEEDLEGGTRRCAHCNRRKKRTKRNKKI
jgi:hypothetical protein